MSCRRISNRQLLMHICRRFQFHPTTSAIDHLSKIPHVETSEMKVTWFWNHQMFRKVLVCSFYRKFQLKILLFGMWRDEVVQMISRGMRRATLCKTLTYLERAESPLSPKVSLTTICDLCLLLRLPDRRGYFPLLCGSWLHFFCFSSWSFGTTEVDHSSNIISPSLLPYIRYYHTYFSRSTTLSELSTFSRKIGGNG